MDFGIPADSRVKTEKKQKREYLDLARKLKKTVRLAITQTPVTNQ